MKVLTVVKYTIVFLSIPIFGILAGVGYQIYLNRFTIAHSQIIKNEAKLKEYLGTRGAFPVKSLSIIPQNIWMTTSDCIAESRGKERVFCVQESTNNGGMTINIYPNAGQIALTEPKTVDRLLNLLIISVFERRFGLDPRAKDPILDKGSGGFIFKW